MTMKSPTPTHSSEESFGNTLLNRLWMAIGYADEYLTRYYPAYAGRSNSFCVSPYYAMWAKRAAKRLYEVVRKQGLTHESQLFNSDFMNEYFNDLVENYRPFARRLLIRYTDFWLRTLFPEWYPILKTDQLNQVVAQSSNPLEAIERLRQIDPIFVTRNRGAIRNSYRVLKQIVSSDLAQQARTESNDKTFLTTQACR